MLNLQPQPNTFQQTSYFELTSYNYPNYMTLERSICEVSVAAGTRLVIRTMEIRANVGGDCAYTLRLNDGVSQYSEQCANELWNTGDTAPVEFDNSGSNGVRVQVSLQQIQGNSAAQGKLWLQLQSKNSLDHQYDPIYCVEYAN